MLQLRGCARWPCSNRLPYLSSSLPQQVCTSSASPLVCASHPYFWTLSCCAPATGSLPHLMYALHPYLMHLQMIVSLGFVYRDTALQPQSRACDGRKATCTACQGTGSLPSTPPHCRLSLAHHWVCLKPTDISPLACRCPQRSSLLHSLCQWGTHHCSGGPASACGGSSPSASAAVSSQSAGLPHAPADPAGGHRGASLVMMYRRLTCSACFLLSVARHAQQDLPASRIMQLPQSQRANLQSRCVSSMSMCIPAGGRRI